MLDTNDIEQIKSIFQITAESKLLSFNAGVEEGRQHSTMSPETKGHLESISQTIKDFCERNSEEHKEIIAQQKHTNGDVGKLKLWRSMLIGAGSVLVLFVGSISSFYFIEKNNQQEKYDEVVRMRVELNSLASQLNKLELTN